MLLEAHTSLNPTLISSLVRFQVLRLLIRGLGKVIDALCDYGEFCAPDTENNARRADIQRRKAVEARLASVQPILDRGRSREADSQPGPRGGVDARLASGRL